MGKAVAIITARGGSKRIPGKNTKNFLGKPVILYSIDAAKTAGCFDEVMVSTDSQEIAEVALQGGAVVPFMRSSKTSDDLSTTADVLVEVLQKYQQKGKYFEYACCIYPTAPFLTGEKLLQAYELIVRIQAKSVVPVVKFSFPIFRSLKIENGLAKMNWPEYAVVRSQDLPPAYHDCGQFYFLRTDSFLKDPKLFTDHTVPIEVPEMEVQDIDSPHDWEIAELKYAILKKRR